MKLDPAALKFRKMESQITPGAEVAKDLKGQIFLRFNSLVVPREG